MKAKDLMTTNIVTCRPSTLIEEAARILSNKHISGMPVTDDRGYVLGIISEVDLLTRKSTQKTVGELMTRAVIAVNEEVPIERIAGQLAQHRIKRVPVTKGGKLVGIVTRADLVRAMAATAEPVEDETQAKPQGLVLRCNNCGHVEPQHKPPPNFCSNCGKPKEHFELVEEKGG